MQKKAVFLQPFGVSNVHPLPFGLYSAPEEFQRRLQAVMLGIDGVAVVADNILIFGKGSTMSDAQYHHDEAMLRVLQRAQESGLKFNKEKLQLHSSELLYIGHRVLSAEIMPDPAKVAAIKHMLVLKSVQDVHRFLGMWYYLARFIPKFLQICENFWRLIKSSSGVMQSREI